jgi:hypothetical protein
MSIKLGSGAVNKIYLGATEVRKIYLGATLIYDKTGGGGGGGPGSPIGLLLALTKAS